MTKSYKKVDRFGNIFYYIVEDITPKTPDHVEFLHRDDGPAYIGINGSKEWRIKGDLHREDGPAIEYEGGINEYWLRGKYYTYIDFLVFTKRFKTPDISTASNFLEI